jgi:RimJ/RimL family protein N-acetyltransferase
MATDFCTSTPRVHLCSSADADRAPFAAMSADPEVMAHLMPMPAREMSDAWIGRQRAYQAAQGFCFWAAEHRGTGIFPGAIGLVHMRYTVHFTPAVEVGWRLARRFWGHRLRRCVLSRLGRGAWLAAQ